jgi:hypothetical protein
MKRYSAFIVIAFFSLFSGLNSQSLELDKSFGNNGIVLDTRPLGIGIDFDIIAMDDGSYFTYGVDISFISEFLSIKKFKNDGTIDNGFGTNGRFNMPVQDWESPLNFIQLPENRIACFHQEDMTKIEVLVLSDSGNIVARSEYSDPEYSGSYMPIKLMFSDGYFFAAGQYATQLDEYLSYDDSIFVIKFDIEGNLDSAFADNGVFSFYGGGFFEFADLELQEDKLLICGTFYDSGYLPQIIRLDSKGVVDSSFANNGIYTHEEGFYFPHLNIDSEGSIYLSGFEAPVVWKLDKDGNPYLDYGYFSMAYEALLETEDIPVFFTILLDDGAVLMFGSDDEEGGNPVIIKYDKNGSLDRDFGTNGIYSEDKLENAFFVKGTIDSKGDLVVIGLRWRMIFGEEIPSVLMARYNFKSTSTYDAENQLRDLTLYPNPVTDGNFNISFYSDEDTAMSFSVLDIAGNIVQHYSEMQVYSGYNEMKLKLNNVLPAGMYVLRIAGDDGLVFRRIVLAE